MRALPALGLTILACTPGGSSISSFGEPSGSPTTEPPASSSSGNPGSTSTGEQSTGDVDTGSSTTSITNDMGSMPDFGPAGPPGCQGKIDFLFVIGDTKFMAPYQERLIAAFPEFITTIASEYADFDAHILVTSTSPGWGYFMCESCLSCSDCTCDAGGPGYPCGAAPELTECDGKLGSGVVFPAGPGATNHRCDLDSDDRYISAVTPDPADAFACIAQLGTPGGGETSAIDAMFAALSDDFNSVHGCNAGFLRKDALLVVTIIDQEGNTPSYTPEVWNWMLADKKSGDEDAIVVLAIQDDSGAPEGTCKPYTKWRNLLLHEFADAVAHGVKGSLCSTDYNDYFMQAATLALQQCEALVPQ